MWFEDNRETKNAALLTTPCIEPAYETLRQAVLERIEGGGLLRMLQAGARAPLFVLHDTLGREVKLEQLLRKGHVVMTFYRGVWCPACNQDLQNLNSYRHEISARGGQLIALSQQTEIYSRRTQRLNHLRYPVLSDVHGLVAQAYGVQWTVPDGVRGVLRASGTDVPCYNGDPSWSLPMAARYVISRDGIICYAEVNADPSTRSGPAAVLPILDGLNHSEWGRMP